MLSHILGTEHRNPDRPSAAIHFRCVKVHTVQLLLHLGRVYLQYAVAHPMPQGVVLHLQHVAYRLQVKRVFCRQSLLKKSRTDVSPCTPPRCTSTGCSSSGGGPPCSPSGASSGVSCSASSQTDSARCPSGAYTRPSSTLRQPRASGSPFLPYGTPAPIRAPLSSLFQSPPISLQVSLYPVSVVSTCRPSCVFLF